MPAKGNKLLDLTGDTYGDWTVIGKAPSRRGSDRIHKFWYCKCKCGTEATVPQAGLRRTSKPTRRCDACNRRHYSKINLRPLAIGSKWGAWTVIRRAAKRNGRSYWVCQCECGFQDTVLQNSLSRGTGTRCKHCRSKGIERMATPHVAAKYLRQIKGCAKERGISFDIDLMDLEAKAVEQDFKCSYTGKKLTFYHPHKTQAEQASHITASLDRIDSSIGYTVANTQWVHKDANLAKMSLSEDRFIELCKQVADHARSKE